MAEAKGLEKHKKLKCNGLLSRASEECGDQMLSLRG